MNRKSISLVAVALLSLGSAALTSQVAEATHAPTALMRGEYVGTLGPFKTYNEAQTRANRMEAVGYTTQVYGASGAYYVRVGRGAGN